MTSGAHAVGFMTADQAADEPADRTAGAAGYGIDTAGHGADASEAESSFAVNLAAYQGPFDVLLSLISQRKLELTQISLSQITGEFIDYVRELDESHGAEETSAFIDVASILIEAKSAALLPHDEQQAAADEQTLEALRERDLLFARLLQYKAFKQAGEDFRARWAANAGRFPHPGAIDPAVAQLLPELVWTVSPVDLARIAARVIANAPADHVSVRQLHVPLADLREQAAIVRAKLRAAGDKTDVTFTDLVADTSTRGEIVARFMALLAFFKQGVVQFRQNGPFEPLHVRWVSANESNDETMVARIDTADFDPVNATDGTGTAKSRNPGAQVSATADSHADREEPAQETQHAQEEENRG